MTFEVLKATEDVAEELGFIHATSYRRAYRGIVPDNILAEYTPQKRAAAFRQAIAKDEDEIYLFKVNHSAVGFAVLNKHPHYPGAAEDEAEINALFFLPDFWGMDAASRALAFCFNRLRLLGYKRATVWVMEGNDRARRFFEKNGFLPTGEKRAIQIGLYLVEHQLIAELKHTINPVDEE